MKNRRIIGFVLAIFLGAFAGLLYGWLVNPPEPKNTELSSLRSDFKADYVLMVAIAYPDLNDTGLAVEKLKELDPQNPLRAVQSALLTAQQLGYSDSDLRALAGLETRIKGISGAVVGQ